MRVQAAPRGTRPPGEPVAGAPAILLRWIRPFVMDEA